ncbi:MAG: hypothetical protein AAB074_20350 [Planctomycetota bacterium]
MKRSCERWVQLVLAFCAAVTLHAIFLTLMELSPVWPWSAVSPARPPDGRGVDLRIAPPQKGRPGRGPFVPAPPPPEAQLNDPKTHRPGLLGLRGVKTSEDLGDDGMALEAALAWLDRHQLPDGGWSASQDCGFAACTAARSATSHAGATSIALLAYLADGITHLDRRTYTEHVTGRMFSRGQSVKGAVKWLINNSKDSKVWAPHDQALAALALTEIYGLTRSGLFRPHAQAYIDSLLARYAWGIRWRTVEGHAVRDAEAAAWMLMAISIGREAGLKLPEDAMPDAVETLLADESNSRLLRVSMASSCHLRLLSSVSSTDWMRAFRSEQLEPGAPDSPDLHALHWALLAARKESSFRPAAWKSWRDPAVTLVVESQRRESSACLAGSWDPPEDARLGRTGSTAQNALTLLTWKRYAPAKPPK